MASLLGKRKRATKLQAVEEGESTEPESPKLDANEIFRRHFEAQFTPLPGVPKTKAPEDEASEEDDAEDSDWDGISDEGEGTVQIIEHTEAQARTAGMTREELKVFMSSKVPQSTSKPSIVPVTTTTENDDASEAANIKKDLELQRFIAESHLLDSSKNPTLSGNNRHKATDLRLQTLGAKSSVLKQAKMPLAHRKGMVAKQTEREETRRREAKENGIILEKAKLGVRKGSDGKRDRGVGAPAVGKFSGGTLKLSKKDIFSIEGPKWASEGGRGGRGGRGSGRGRGRGRGKRAR